MHVRPLQDETDRQRMQCMQYGIAVDERDEDEQESAWGADPFDIVAEIEEQQGYPLARN